MALRKAGMQEMLRMYSYSISRPVIAALIILCLLPVPFAAAELGDVVNWFYTASPYGNDYYGGITWKDGYLYENVAKTAQIYQRDPQTGEVLASITVSDQAKDAGITWDPDHNCWWVAEPWIRGCGKLPPAGGAIEWSEVEFIRHIYGIHYDPIEGVLLASANARSEVVRKWNVDSSPPQHVGDISVDFPLGGVVRAGDKLWVSSLQYETGPFYVYELELDGTFTGRKFQLPEGREAWELAFDGTYLWVRSNWAHNSLKIYQIDIGGGTAPPTPAPTAAVQPTAPPPPPPGGGNRDILDYNGDGRSDVGIYRPTNGLWAIRNITRLYLGGGDDLPVPGDYNGDGTTEPAVFRPRSGLWADHGGLRIYFGREGDTPLTGDFNGDGSEDCGIFRPETGLWAIRSITRRYLGSRGDIPLGGDCDGDGTDDPGIFRPATGLWAYPGITRTYFGRDGDRPLPADFSGGGSAAVTVFRSEKGLWAVQNITRVYYGAGGYIPQPADWNGDGIIDITAYFQYGDGYWWAADELGVIPFGAEGDRPVGARLFENSEDDTPFPFFNTYPGRFQAGFSD